MRETPARGPRSLSLVESGRAERVRPRPLRALGRKEVLQASGELARRIASLARHSERSVVLEDMEAGALPCVRIGGPLLFGRLWDRLGWGAVVKELLDGRGVGFAVARAVFVSVLPRLFGSGSDRSCETGMADDALAGLEGWRLHQRDRARAGLGEEREAPAAGALAPRGVQEAGAERRFERRRDLFTDLSVVFMDTPTRAVPGAGGEPLGAHGPSTDHRPDLRQRVLAGGRDGAGRPGGTEMLPGNTAAIRVLLPMVARLRSRLRLGRVGVVADRGMLSAAPRAALEERGRASLLGARERRTQVVRAVGRKDAKPFVPLLIERVRGETQRFVKEVPGGGARYSVCRNEAEAQQARADRQAVGDGLPKRLASGEQALSGTRADRRSRRRTGAGKAFEIDAGKLAGEARFDGLFGLRTPAGMTPLKAVRRSRELLPVADLFRRAKAQLRPRPIDHSCDAARRGQGFCSFLALVLQKELAARCRTADVSSEWHDLIRDLDRLQQAPLEKDGKRITTRPPVEGQGGKGFQALGSALPPTGANTKPDPRHNQRNVVGTLGRACVTRCNIEYF